MDGMSATEEDSVFEVEEEEGETYFRTEHVSRTEELQEEVDMAAKVMQDLSQKQSNQYFAGSFHAL